MSLFYLMVSMYAYSQDPNTLKLKINKLEINSMNIFVWKNIDISLSQFHKNNQNTKEQYKIHGQQIPKKNDMWKVCLLYISTVILQVKNIN